MVPIQLKNIINKEKTRNGLKMAPRSIINLINGSIQVNESKIGIKKD
jgi:hypothetical protein